MLKKLGTIAGINANWSLLKQGNQLLLCLALAQGIGLAILINAEVNRDQPSYLVPPTLTEKASVSKNNADAVYIKSFGLYVTTLIGNLTPNNIQFVLESLSPIMSPESYSLIRKQLIALSQDVTFKSWVGSTHFEPTEVIYEADTQKVFVPGYMTDVNTTGKKNKNPVVYEMKVRIVNYRPLVSDLISYPGVEAKTLKWLELHPDVASKESN